MPDEPTALSDREREVVERVAQMRGISFEEAASLLVQEALANRVRRKTGRRPASNVRPFKR